MRNKERWPMYFFIQQMKDLGLKKSQVARNLGISRNTVFKFWNMTPDEYNAFLEGLEIRTKKLDTFEQEIIHWLQEYPDLSAAQVMDWLKERHGNLAVAESTVRNYVRAIRMKYAIPKTMRVRQYEAMSDPPMGKQMQADLEKPR